MPRSRLALICLLAAGTLSACQGADLARNDPSITVTPSTLNFGEAPVELRASARWAGVRVGINARLAARPDAGPWDRGAIAH